jgi:hypothetical protein
MFTHVCFCVIRPSSEVVKEGRILNNPKDFTKLNLVASGTFSEDGQKEDWKEMMFCHRPLKHLFGKVILQRFV